ncbi:MAG: replicative DNA helicase [Parcubacteria group bacterium]|nr:replicative DNA helicase [Parcubacteria group bacterium]
MATKKKETTIFIPEDKLPPQDIETEQSVLGALMLDKNAISRVADILDAEDFYRTNHQQIYETILELFEKNQPIDILTVSSRLKEKELLEEAGGMGYLASLVNLVPTSSHVAHYANIVHKKRVLRDLIAASYEIGALAREEEKDVNEILDEAEQKVFRISQKSAGPAFAHIKEDLKEAFNRIDQLHKGGGKLRGVSTGFSLLDQYLAGLQKSDLIILAARPSLGKTALALDIARHAALHEKVPVGIFSMEMSREQVVDRLIASEAMVDLWKLRTGRLSDSGNPSDFDLVQEAMSRLSEAPIFIDDAPTPTVIQMRTMARRLQAEMKLGLLIVDYLQLIQPHTQSDNMVQQVTAISRGLKALARELSIPVIAISQLSRAVEQRPHQIPKLSDLRESGSIEQDADVVAFIYREDRVRDDSEKRNMADIIIAKHRNGPLGRVTLHFAEQYVSFRDMEKEEYSEAGIEENAMI